MQYGSEKTRRIIFFKPHFFENPSLVLHFLDHTFSSQILLQLYFIVFLLQYSTVQMSDHGIHWFLFLEKYTCCDAAVNLVKLKNGQKNVQDMTALVK